MTIKNTLFTSFIFLVLASASTQSFAVESLSTEELISHCKEYSSEPEGLDGIFCIRYIQGFIDGAVATDERVALNVASEYEKEETLTQRAIRTRLGSRLERFGPSYYAGFCLGEPLLLVEVTKTVIKDLSALNDLQGRELAREVVYETLRREYPCETSGK